MPHCFEARFRTARPITAEKLEQEFQAAAFKRPLEFFRPHGMNTYDGWLAVKSCGYANFGEAEASGALFHDGLLIVAAKQKLGVEFYLRGAYGIHVNSGQMELSDPGLPLPTVLTNNDLKEMLGATVESAAPLTTNQRVAAELLNDSFFNMSPEASFLLRVSAVEALCPQADQTDAFRTIVDSVLTSTSILKDAPSSDQDQIEQALKRLAKRQSVRSAYMSKIKQLIGDDKAKQFETIYEQRSKFLHDGAGRGALGAPSDAALELGLELLLADIKQTSPSS
jgi:hypothetical protein